MAKKPDDLSSKNRKRKFKKYFRRRYKRSYGRTQYLRAVPRQFYIPPTVALPSKFVTPENTQMQGQNPSNSYFKRFLTAVGPPALAGLTYMLARRIRGHRRDPTLPVYAPPPSPRTPRRNFGAMSFLPTPSRGRIMDFDNMRQGLSPSNLNTPQIFRQLGNRVFPIIRSVYNAAPKPGKPSNPYYPTVYPKFNLKDEL